MSQIERPQAGEYLPYFKRYIALVPADTELLEHLSGSLQPLVDQLKGLSEAQLLYRYQPEKWTIKEVLLHLIDCERIFCNRALRIARGEQTPLPGFEENAYVAASGANERSGESLLEEMQAVRQATLTLLHGLPTPAWMRTGTANEGPMSVRALAYIIAGHALHHQQILKERYGLH